MPVNKIYSRIFEFYLNPEVYRRRLFLPAAFGRSVWTRLGTVLQSLLGNLYKNVRFREPVGQDIKGQPWVVCGTTNQEDSTGFLVDRGYRLVATNDYKSRRPANRINWFRWPKIICLPKYLPFLWRAYRENPTHFSRVFQILIHGVGAYENQLRVLRRFRPSIIVMSNDHLPFYRALSLAARAEGIPTVYLQHAPVAEDFPALLNDLALLDGQDAYDKYHRPGLPAPAGKVLVTGKASYDAFAHLKQEGNKVKVVGIAYAMADEPACVAETVTRLCAAFPEIRFIVRKHPLDVRPLSLPVSRNITLSDARATPVFEFLQQLDVLVAGESGIHLEGALLNVPSVYYQFLMNPGVPGDNYGLLAKELMPHARSVTEVESILEKYKKQRPDVRSRAGYFVANLEGEWAGRVSERVWEEVESLRGKR